MQTVSENRKFAFPYGAQIGIRDPIGSTLFILGFGIFIIIIRLFLRYVPYSRFIEELAIQDLIQSWAPYGLYLITFICIAPKLFKRSILSFITGRSSFLIQNSLYAFGVTIICLIAVDATLSLFTGQGNAFEFETNRPFLLLLISAFLILLPCVFEELIFRGFLLQTFQPTKSPPIFGALASSLIFALLHLWNPDIEHFGLIPMFLYFFTAAFMLCILAILSNGIELPIGVHTANNIYAVLIVNLDSTQKADGSLISIPSNLSFGILYGSLCLSFCLLFVILKIQNKINSPHALFKTSTYNY